MSVDMRDVDSTAVSQVGYDMPKKRLYVNFRRGGIWYYDGISQEVFENILDSNSIGETVNILIRSVKGHKA